MNKKQLIVTWIMGIIICIVIIFTPKVYFAPSYLVGRYYYKKNGVGEATTITKIQWDSVLQRSLITLIIGVLLIYTLRDKKR